MGNLRRNNTGDVAMAFAVFAPVIGAVLSFVIDLSSVFAAELRVQVAADAAALALAQSVAISPDELRDHAGLNALATPVALAQLESDAARAGAHVTARSVNGGRAVEVVVDAPATPYTGLFRGGDRPPRVAAKPIARLTSGRPLCVLALNSKQRAIVLGEASSVDTGRCIVQSNSTHPQGISAERAHGALIAGEIRSRGGFSGAASAFHPKPVGGYPALNDPLASRPPPKRPGGNARRVSVSKGRITLEPGHYAQIEITGTADVRLNPGVFYISQSRLFVGPKAKLTGDDVGIFLERSGLTFEPGSEVRLSAPRDGPMAGMLIWRGPWRGNQEFKFNSAGADKLLGTIYLPDGAFISSVDGKVAEDSAHTIIVARDVRLSGQTELVINSRYDETDIPVPVGLGEPLDRIRLSQ